MYNYERLFNMKSLLVFATVLLVGTGSLMAEQTGLKEVDDSQPARSSGGGQVLTTVPSSGLSRFLFYNTRPTESHQTPLGNVYGYKRSSSALDALTGVTLGKRSLPVELVNFEPIFGRQMTMHSSMPRMYDMRWAPFDASEPAIPNEMS